MDKAKNVAKIGGKLLGRIAVPLTVAMSAFQVISTENDENLDRTEKNIAHTKTGAGLGGAVAGAAAGAAIGSVVPVVGTIIGGLIGGGLGYFLGGEIGETVAEEVSSKTDTGNVSGNTTLSDEDKQLLAEAAEKMGAVDIGRGHGDIDDLEKLSKLDVGSLESLLDMETWKPEDLATIQSIVAAKKEGRAVTYVPEDKGSKWDPFDNIDETLTFGEAGTVSESPTVQGVDLTGSGVVGDNADQARLEAIDRLEGANQYTEMGSNNEKQIQAKIDKLKGMSAEEFNALTPDKTTMDDFYKAGVNPGSIFVHDMHVEQVLTNLTKQLGMAEAIPAGYLDQATVTAAMRDQNTSGGGAQILTNAPQTTIDNSTKQVINPGSTAHAPAQPAGSGHMGISTPRG